ncbi:MAG: DUF4282 domain-containing protein [Pseudonocardiales bacterium]|nr:DUF4282 domain-containing protein [Pseudonocardiales bacterium]
MTHSQSSFGSDQPRPPKDVGAPSPVWRPQTKGFFASLFDFGFNHFITPSIIRVLYVLGLIVIGLGYLSFIIASFGVNGAFGIIGLLLGLIASVAWAAFWRVTLEFFLSVVRMSEDIHNLRLLGYDKEG